MGLEEAGVDYDTRRGVVVNDRLQTSNPDIYAVGDVATRYQFTHSADFMARLVVRNALFFGRDRFSRLLIPWAVYTQPEIAHVGLYERDLEERDREYVTFTRPLANVDRAIVDGATEGFVRISRRERQRRDPRCNCGRGARWRPHLRDHTRHPEWHRPRQARQRHPPVSDHGRSHPADRRHVQPHAAHTHGAEGSSAGCWRSSARPFYPAGKWR